VSLPSLNLSKQIEHFFPNSSVDIATLDIALIAAENALGFYDKASWLKTSGLGSEMAWSRLRIKRIQARVSNSNMFVLRRH
jgi:hypothetical protein